MTTTNGLAISVCLCRPPFSRAHQFPLLNYQFRYVYTPTRRCSFHSQPSVVYCSLSDRTYHFVQQNLISTCSRWQPVKLVLLVIRLTTRNTCLLSPLLTKTAIPDPTVLIPVEWECCSFDWKRMLSRRCTCVHAQSPNSSSCQPHDNSHPLNKRKHARSERWFEKLTPGQIQYGLYQRPKNSHVTITLRPPLHTVLFVEG